MIKTILKNGVPLLEQSIQSVALFDQQLLDHVNDMIETMRYYHGVGLAANQIGINQRIVIIEVNQNPRYPEQSKISLMVLVNPQIEMIGNFKESYMEGCLSIPDYRGEVLRNKSIRYQAFDQFGNQISGIADGFLARIIQHELDHLNGILFTQRVNDMED
jgi:peptide deformylase